MLIIALIVNAREMDSRRKFLQSIGGPHNFLPAAVLATWRL